MVPSDPLHGVPACLSEETRAVVNCLVARMVQLMAELLASPDHVPARRDDLDALLCQETATAISECGLLPLPLNSRDPRLCPPLQPPDLHHQHGEEIC